MQIKNSLCRVEEEELQEHSVKEKLSLLFVPPQSGGMENNYEFTGSKI